ncbi:MAG TPA: carbohydrate ABC transporter permease [Clostridiales bacterium]|nr:carbohydrate ABC transporter permease [Clostridiales bacterium]
MIILMVIFVYPVLNVIAISFSDYQSIAKGTVTIFPQGFTVSSYTYVLKDKMVYYGYGNTIAYAAVYTLLNLLLTSLIAYPLTKKDFVGSKFVTVFLTITMFFNGGLIPTYLLMRDLKLLDTFWVMVIPGTVSAYNCFIFRTFFNNIPHELSESAYLDGASDYRILAQIILPLSKPLLATFALFAIVWVWNSWFNALLYLNDQYKYPLQLILRNYLFVIDNNQLQQQAGVATSVNPLMQRKIDPKGVRMAMVVVTMFPIMMAYPYFQKYFMKGVMIGAIKG